MVDKQELRKHVRRLKASLAAAELSEMSTLVCNRVRGCAPWTVARTVLLYHPLADEVDVRPLLQAALDDGKQVLLPVVVGDDLLLRSYAGPNQMAVGAFGILEPTGDVFAPAGYDRIDLVVVPGMAFDSDGHRLGRGRGYYDRLLPRIRHARRVGVCFPFQLVEQVPSEVHDVVMDQVICG